MKETYKERWMFFLCQKSKINFPPSAHTCGVHNSLKKNPRTACDVWVILFFSNRIVSSPALRSRPCTILNASPSYRSVKVVYILSEKSVTLRFYPPMASPNSFTINPPSTTSLDPMPNLTQTSLPAALLRAYAKNVTTHALYFVFLHQN